MKSEFLVNLVISSNFLAFSVIRTNNAVHSVLNLILVFCVNTILILNLGVEFLALIFVIVYVGAIAVLFLFVIMMLNIKNPRNYGDRTSLGRLIISLITFDVPSIRINVLMGLCSNNVSDVLILKSYDYQDLIENFELNFEIEQFSLNIDTLFNISLIGLLIYTHFYIYFIIAGIILLQAMVGAIVLTMTKHRKIKRQNIFSQVSRKSINAIFLISVKK